MPENLEPAARLRWWDAALLVLRKSLSIQNMRWQTHSCKGMHTHAQTQTHTRTDVSDIHIGSVGIVAAGVDVTSCVVCECGAGYGVSEAPKMSCLRSSGITLAHVDYSV